MAWSIIVVEPALSWLHGLRRTDRRTLILISQAIEALTLKAQLSADLWTTQSRAPLCPTSKNYGPRRPGLAKCGCYSYSTHSAKL